MRDPLQHLPCRHWPRYRWLHSSDTTKRRICVNSDKQFTEYELHMNLIIQYHKGLKISKESKNRMYALSDRGGGAEGPPPPPGPVKTSQKKMATMRSRKFRKSCPPSINKFLDPLVVRLCHLELIWKTSIQCISVY